MIAEKPAQNYVSTDKRVLTSSGKNAKKKTICRKKYVACAVCLSYGEESGKGAGLTLNFAVTDAGNLLKIKKLVKKYYQLVDFKL